jgi:beta-glucuronidase
MIRSFLRTGLLAGALALAVASTAGAQGPGYAASPPSRGAMYVDGQNNRYLLGGAWLFRPDRADLGLAQGWGRDVSGTDGWSVLSVPNSFNAGDLSNASMAGYVGWYRRDFTLPSDAFAQYVRAADRHWIVRFESVNYRATVWLNGRRIATHDGAYLPFEIDLKGLRPGVHSEIDNVPIHRRRADHDTGA